jgi:formate dehydrogenase
MAKVVGVLCDDPIAGYPAAYGWDDLSRIDCCPDAHALRKYLEGNGHQLVVTSDKDGPDSVFERELVDADIVISEPFSPASLTASGVKATR